MCAGSVRTGFNARSGRAMKYRLADSWRRWTTHFCCVQLQLVVGGAIVLAGEVNLAGLQLLPTPWDKEANFAELQHCARRAGLGLASVAPLTTGYAPGLASQRSTRGYST